MHRDPIDDLLAKTSRTFALAIPMLPWPTRRQVGIAYLLFRIADTFEDGVEWSGARRIRALERFVQLLRRPVVEDSRHAARRWSEGSPIRHQGYLELLEQVPEVLQAYSELEPAARDAIREHTIRTAEGMSDFVARSDAGVLRLNDVADLRHYCYVVAGTVGEMLTELFLLGRDRLHRVRGFLQEGAARFGEGLQLVNILRDASFDNEEGRCYLPPDVGRRKIFALAREDLATAVEYTCLLQEAGGHRGIVEFCALPVRLALATLDRIETDGPGAKLSRDEVFRIVRDLHHALDHARPAVST